MKKVIFLIIPILFLISFQLSAQNVYKLFINEIRADDNSTDDINFLELIGPSGTSIANFEVYHYNQASAYQWKITFSSFNMPDDGINDNNGNSLGFFVLAQSSIVINYDQISATFNPQNGPGDFLILKDGEGNILDAVAWGSPTSNYTSLGLTKSGNTSANNYLHTTSDDTDHDNSLQAPNNVLGDDGSGWLYTTATPGVINSGQTSGQITLPVTLSTFTAQYFNSKPTLYWQTQSETDNMGWFIYRNTIEDFTSAEKITGMIEGHGTTTQPQSYIYEDAEELQIEQTYYYWLESVDYSGTIHHYDRVAQVTIPHPNDPGQNVTPPIAYDITADPNPFSQTTEITFALNQTSRVDVAIYNIKGELVKSFGTVMTNVDEEVSFQWNGKDNTGKSLSNGVYLYSVKVNGKGYATKQLILMR